ncbi:DUF559 domain-containing protein [Leptolyngbya sp. FACHB-261]|nr:DUF559 domain-containing protein [Leptolyngbya sp. FACHB-261]
MTEEEKLLWQRLRGNRLNGLRFRRQQIIDGFIADFYCHAAKEVDGAIHQQQAEYDAARDQILTAHNLKLLRIPNKAVRQNLPEVLQQITNACTPQPQP